MGFWYHRQEQNNKDPLRLFRILIIGILCFSLAGCSSAFAAENFTKNRGSDKASHAAQILPPAWTATPVTSAPSLDENPSVVPYTPPTQAVQTPLYLYKSRSIIGYSVRGLPLEVFQFGSGPADLMIVAGIHGGYEWNTIALADEIIEFLEERPEIIPPRVSLHILRSLNPDGTELKNTPWGRGNANDVDLNRNWDSHWSEDVPKPNCWDIIPLNAGPHPSSEPETQALMQYLSDQGIEAMISYHSAALGIFAGGRPATQESLDLAEAIAEVSRYPYPPIDIGCEYTGTMTDWAADHGIAAIDIELSTHWSTDFRQNLVILMTFLNWQQ